MGIQVEFNPDLCLRAFRTECRLEEECLPKKLEVGVVYRFQKEGQRNFWLEGEIPLRETEGNGVLSRPLASVIILESTHRMFADKKIYTIGDYLVNEVFDVNDDKINFEGYERIK